MGWGPSGEFSTQYVNEIAFIYRREKPTNITNKNKLHCINSCLCLLALWLYNCILIKSNKGEAFCFILPKQRMSKLSDPSSFPITHLQNCITTVYTAVRHQCSLYVSLIALWASITSPKLIQCLRNCFGCL